MADNYTENDLVKSWKSDIISQEELKNTGVEYESRETNNRFLQILSERIAVPQARWASSIRGGVNEYSPTLNRASTTISCGQISKLKEINLVGQSVRDEDALAQTLSQFRDPRTEILNVVYTSNNGKILGHTAWTNCLIRAVLANSPEIQTNIYKTLDLLKADNLYISHNHPSADPEPSFKDIEITIAYQQMFHKHFRGQFVFDTDKYNFINPDGSNFYKKLIYPQNDYFTPEYSKTDYINSSTISSYFSEILREPDTLVFAFIRNSKIISWTYGDVDKVLVLKHLKDYVRACSASGVVGICNNEKCSEYIVNIIENSLGTNNNIFLDFINVDDKGIDKYHYMPDGIGEWQSYEDHTLKYIIKNTPIIQTINISNEKQFVTNVLDIKQKENVMAINQFQKNLEKAGLPMNMSIEEKTKYINDNAELQPDGTLKVSADVFKSLSTVTDNGFEKAFLDMSIENNPNADPEIIERAKFLENVKTFVRDGHGKTTYYMKDGSVQTDSPARRADENINRKETKMSDFDENEEVVVTERNYQEEAFRNAINSRIVISNALKEGTLSCLPNAEGFADTEKIINAVTGKVYHGDNLLILKEHQKQNNCPTGEYITFDQLEKMKKDKPNLYIRKGEKGVSIYFSEKIEGSDKYEHKHARLINISQTSNPKEIKEWIEQKHIEDQKRVEEYYKSQGKNYTPKPQTQSNNPEVVKCTSTEPAKYLGEYLAAVSMGSKFEVTKEQAKEFANNFGNKLWEKTGVSPKTGEPITNPFMLSKITNEASKHCVETMKNIHIQQNKVDQPKQEQTQSQSRGR